MKRAQMLVKLLSIAAAAPVMTELAQSAGALEKAVDIAENVIGAIAGFVQTLLAAQGTIESAALVDYYDVDKYEVSATQPEHDKETNALITKAWASARKAREAKSDALQKCKHLPSYAQCFKDIVAMQESAADANAYALAATKRAIALIHADMEELERLGAGWSFYHGEERETALEVGRMLDKDALLQAIAAYTTIDTIGKAALVAGSASSVEDTVAQVLAGDYFSVSIVKAPAQYHKAFNALVGHHGEVFQLLEGHNDLEKAATSMHATNKAWEKQCNSAVSEAESELTKAGKEEPWLVSEVRGEWEIDSARVAEAKKLKDEGVLVRGAMDDYWLATSTARFQEAHDKAVLALDGLGAMMAMLRDIAEQKREECYASANATTAMGIALEGIAEEHCKRGDKETLGRAVQHYEKGAYQKALLSSGEPVSDVKALLAKAKVLAAGDAGKLKQIALLEEELRVAEKLDPETALPLLTSIADRAMALMEEAPAEEPPMEMMPAEKTPGEGEGVEPEEGERETVPGEAVAEWDTSTAEAKLKDLKKALDTVVELNFTVATVMDEEDWLEFKDRVGALKERPDSSDYARRKAELESVEDEMHQAIVGSMQRAKTEHETALAVMESEGVFDYAYVLENSRQEYEKGYYNRAFIYAAYAKAMAATQKSPATGLVTSAAAPLLIGVAVVVGIVWKLRSRKKEPEIRKVLKKIRGRESSRSSQRGPISWWK